MDETFERLMDDKVKRIAIMGGTFDPIHYGHLVTAEAVWERYNIDRVVFVPSGNPPHKINIEVTDAEYRFSMVQMAISANPHFRVSRIEIDRKGYTYTIDTIREIKAAFGGKLHIYFITGADALLEIMTWKEANELLKECSYVAVTRPGYMKKDLYDWIDILKKKYGADISAMDVPAFAISSTDIRNRVRNGRSIKYLVPQNVEEYILKNKLYA